MSVAMRLLLGSVLALVAACEASRPDVQNLALRQQCDREAAAWFKARHPHGVSHETVDIAIRSVESTYITHLAGLSKRCYVIVNEDTSAAFDDRDSSGRSERTLYAMGDEKPLALLIARWPAPTELVDACQVLGRPCSSSDEWQRWVAAAWDR